MADEKTTDPLEAAAKIKLTQALGQTGAGQAGSGSGAQETGAGAGTAGAGAGAQGRSASAETGMDIGQAEAYVTNMKRLVARELDADAHLQVQLVALNNRILANTQDFDSQVRSISLQALTLGQTALQNAVALSNRVNNASVDLDTRIKHEAVTADGRRGGNDETHDKNIDSITESERERTTRGGDAGDVIRWSKISSDQTFQEAIEAAVVRAFVKSSDTLATAVARAIK